MTTYSEAGVDIHTGDKCSKIMFNAAKQTWKNRKGDLGEIISPFESFSGIRGINVSKLPQGTFLGMNFDGIGTKAEIAERLNKHDTLAYDLFAMVCDDAIVNGGEPVLVGSILDVNKLDIEIIKQLAKGYIDAAKQGNVAVINGEIAELGNRISGFGDYNYNWGAACIWFGNKKTMFTGKEIKPGQTIIAFEEKGFRSNGLSLLRKIMEEEWNNKTLEQALVPSQIYSKAVVKMFGKLKGVSHITGGGIPGKLGRVLKPSGFGAELNELFEPCELMKLAISLGDVPMEEAYKTWNMGNGMLVITEDKDAILDIAKKEKINAKVCGKVIKEKKIRINELEFKL